MTAPNDPSTCVVRDAVIGDAAGLLATERSIVEAGAGVVQDLSDLPADVDSYRTALEGRINSSPDSGVFLVAAAGPVIVGHIEIERLRPARLRHVAVLAIGVHPDWQGAGVGKALMQTALERVKEISDPGIARIELGVAATNIRAQRLYERFGFAVEGRRKRFHRMPSGAEVDDLTMVLFP